MSQQADSVWFIQTAAALEAAGRVAETELAAAIQHTGAQLGDRQRAGRRIHLDLGADDLSAEGYRIIARPDGESLTLSCAAPDKRGLIYAAYDLAERIRHREPLEDLQVVEEPLCTMRRIYTLWADHNITMGSLIPAMPRWRMNALCLYGSCHIPADRPGLMIYHFQHYLSLPLPYRKYPQVNKSIESSSYYQRTRDSFTNLLRTAREHEIDVYVLFGLLSFVPLDDDGPHYGTIRQALVDNFPELLLEGQDMPDWDSPLVWQYVQNQLEELFTLYPDLAGINLHTDEMTAFNLGHVMSGGTLDDRRRWIRKMVDTVEAICEKYGKRCYWNLHGCGNLFVDTLVEIGKSRPGGLRLCSESSPVDMPVSDRFPSYPFEKLAAAGDGMSDHDVIIQYAQAYPWLPNVVDHYIVRHILKSIESGLRGGGALWWEDGPYYSPLNSLSAINMELLSRLLWNPQEPLDDIWNRWLRRRFGERAAPAAGHLLRSTHDVLNGIFFFNKTNGYFWFDFGLFWMWFYQLQLEGLLGVGSWRQLVEYFQPAGTPIYSNPWNAACKERTLPMSQMREEKQTAIRQSQELLDYLVQHQADFAPADYVHLLPRYVAMHHYARVCAQIVEAIYNFTHLHVRAYDPECLDPRRGMERALAEIDDIYLEMLADPRLRLFEPDVYSHGLRLWFLDHVQPALSDIRFQDRLLSDPSIVESLPAEKQERARGILANADIIRDKFQRNARGEVDAEKEWAALLGDLE